MGVKKQDLFWVLPRRSWRKVCCCEGSAGAGESKKEELSVGAPATWSHTLLLPPAWTAEIQGSRNLLGSVDPLHPGGL